MGTQQFHIKLLNALFFYLSLKSVSRTIKSSSMNRGFWDEFDANNIVMSACFCSVCRSVCLLHQNVVAFVSVLVCYVIVIVGLTIIC